MTEQRQGWRVVRRGYATEGSRALIRKRFTAPGVRRVVAQTMTVNRVSRRVMEKCGLRLVRLFHQGWPDPIPGTAEGEVVYALTREEWAAGDGATVPVRAAEGQHNA